MNRTQSKGDPSPDAMPAGIDVATDNYAYTGHGELSRLPPAYREQVINGMASLEAEREALANGHQDVAF